MRPVLSRETKKKDDGARSLSCVVTAAAYTGRPVCRARPRRERFRARQGVTIALVGTAELHLLYMLVAQFWLLLFGCNYMCFLHFAV